MLEWKDILCLLAILAAYGLAGRLDYEDAIAMEEALRGPASPIVVDEAPPPQPRDSLELPIATCATGPACRLADR